MEHEIANKQVNTLEKQDNGKCKYNKSSSEKRAGTLTPPHIRKNKDGGT